MEAFEAAGIVLGAKRDAHEAPRDRAYEGPCLGVDPARDVDLDGAVVEVGPSRSASVLLPLPAKSLSMRTRTASRPPMREGAITSWCARSPEVSASDARMRQPLPRTTPWLSAESRS
jgi:hypothetical protein